ncbi:uncharacterized protein LAESUDRAFT_727268 [Laetiporus sulphureus 93-53]|uniref:Uncharacterized protein n=1 Tax=Laetiporus sulphureus 93-53 TaxID=1314785 RepID=A0A165DP36_9APHY|nr:uncharacterized protein LAESUDRAFT_727268 [Laetiporus sulphureus 93-53]KZT05311.1 hypothetical protein LAESUDRAFT_727268 [Laetiporus sulphureus 93-53]
MVFASCTLTDTEFHMEGTSESGSSAPSRARGRGRSRGGLGKYLRARGRGRGRGRPAEWGKRLVLEDEEEGEPDEEDQQEVERKYARRELGTNADRYAEPEPELDSEGEEIVEPEVDLTSFLERQRLSSQPPLTPPPPDEDDIDHSLAGLSIGRPTRQTKKGKVKQIEWDKSLEEMRRDQAAAEAKRELKTRFRAQTAQQRGRANLRGTATSRGKARSYVEAPHLSTKTRQPAKPEKEDMQEFLDDLLR